MASINRRPDGRWRARYRDDSGREHARHFDRKVDGQRWLNEVTAAVVTGDYVDPKAGRVTFEGYYRLWRERQVWATGTRAAMDQAVGSVTFAHVPLGSLRRSHIEHWVKAMTTGAAATRGKPLGAGTIQTRMNNVRSILRGAVADRLIPRDPSQGVPLPRRRRAEVAMRIPAPAGVGSLLAAADLAFRPYVALCAFAGLRLGEAAGVQVADVDFLRRELAVSRQVQRANGGGVEIRAPKYGSERVVYLPDDLLALLAEHVRTQVPASPAERWLFRGRDHDPPHHNTIGFRWRRTVAAAGLPADTHLHSLRHYYASGLIASGCDVVTVQRALGHSDAGVTLRTYAHLWPTAADRTRSAAAAMWDEAMPRLADSVRTSEAELASDLR